MTNPNPPPSLSEGAIRSRASQQSFVRGEEYFEDGSVIEVIWREGQLTAEIQGSEYEPYIVRVDIAGEGIARADCTCPYDWGGDCKHIVAALLFLARRPQRVAHRPPLTDLLTPLNREKLLELILDLAADVPAILDPIERLVARIGPKKADRPKTSSKPQPPIDFNLLRRQIKAELRASIRTGYDSWGEESFYDSNLGAALEPALEQAQALLDAGDPRSALAVLEAAADAWDDGIASLDEYVIEAFEDIAEEFTHTLAKLWTEALLSADLSLTEREDWIAMLDEYTESFYGGGSLEMTLTAAQHGWDYPPLVAAMRGNITGRGAWENEAPDYADCLAEIRLRVLDRRGQHQEYLNLAQAEGRFMRYLHMLVRMDQVDKAETEAVKWITNPEDIHALAGTMAEHIFVDEAFSLAQHGLGLESSRGKAGLAEWLRDQAQSSQRTDLALMAAQRALDESVSLDNYKALQKIAGQHWEQLKPAAIEATARSTSAKGKVDVYLYEEMYPKAIEVVDSSHWYFEIEPVIEAVKGVHPEWAFGQYSKRADQIMDAGRAKDYALAADWLWRGRDILAGAGLQARWNDHLSGLMETHQRKYKLMPMLEKLREK